jgi:glycosyltransferase involved in cell wall biosynthesis
MRNKTTDSALANDLAKSRARYLYVLITAARDEELYIERTLQSVVNQTIRPIKWIVVSDGSTDRTNEIVNEYALIHEWIELLRMPDHAGRDFAAKAACFNTAYQKVKHLQYDVVGNVDADTSFEPDHFEFLMQQFAADPQLGVAGTSFIEHGAIYDYRFASVEHVSGPCQLFRRECFQQIGGYRPLKRGGVDVVAVLTARMNGWKARTFTEKAFVHHRRMGTAGKGITKAKFKHGATDYVLGSHPLWALLRSVFQMSRRPFIVGGCLLLAGFLWSMIQNEEIQVDDDVLKFRRQEQMQRLKTLIRAWIVP